MRVEARNEIKGLLRFFRAARKRACGGLEVVPHELGRALREKRLGKRKSGLLALTLGVASCLLFAALELQKERIGGAARADACRIKALQKGYGRLQFLGRGGHGAPRKNLLDGVA